MFALPIDMINAFRHRPKPRKSSSMKKTKDNLVDAVNKLIKEGEALKEEDNTNQRNEDAGCLERWSGNRRVNNKLTEFKAKYYGLN